MKGLIRFNLLVYLVRCSTEEEEVIIYPLLVHLQSAQICPSKRLILRQIGSAAFGEPMEGNSHAP